LFYFLDVLDTRLNGLSIDTIRRPVIRSLHRGTTESGDCNKVGIVFVCRAFIVISDGRKGMEALNKGRMTVEQMRNAFDNTGSVNSILLTKVRGSTTIQNFSTHCSFSDIFYQRGRRCKRKSDCGHRMVRNLNLDGIKMAESTRGQSSE